MCKVALPLLIKTAGKRPRTASAHPQSWQNICSLTSAFALRRRERTLSKLTNQQDARRSASQWAPPPLSMRSYDLGNLRRWLRMRSPTAWIYFVPAHSASDKAPPLFLLPVHLHCGQGWIRFKSRPTAPKSSRARANLHKRGLFAKRGHVLRVNIT